MNGERKIIHIDMDAFYASVEQRDFPEYQGKPLVVGGKSGRGVIAAASYEARKFGVKSAMPTAQALKLCPNLIIVPTRMERYKEISQAFRKILLEYTNLIEPLALDEAYMDVTHNKKKIHTATEIASQIKARVKDDLSLTCSAGISINKFLAKVASDLNKPDGLTLIRPSKVIPFLEQLPIYQFHGIGKKTAEKLVKAGIFRGKDLKKRTEKELLNLLGKSGKYYYQVVRGIENRAVNPVRDTKSVSSERTFERDLVHLKDLQEVILKLAPSVWDRAQRVNHPVKTVTVKAKYNDFTLITRSKTLPTPIASLQHMNTTAMSILENIDIKAGIRLLGIGVSFGYGEERDPAPQQLTLEF